MTKKLSRKVSTGSIGRRTNRYIGAFTALVLVALVAVLVRFPLQAQAACNPSTNYGTDTMSVSVPSSTTYTIWVRMKTDTASSNSIMLQVDGGNCYNVGGSSSLPLNTWTWVNYQNGSTSQEMQLSLSQGTHSLELFGNQSGISIDNILLLAGDSCTNPSTMPVGFGTNCTPSPVPPPTAPTNLEASANGPTSVSLNWTASTDSGGPGLAGYYILRTSDGTTTKLGPVTGTSYNDTAVSANTSYSYTVEAYDTASTPDYSTQSTPVSITTPYNNPSSPTGVTVSAPSYNEVNLSWTASSDNGGPGIGGYYILRAPVNGGTIGQYATLNQTTSTSYQDKAVLANTSYSYEIEAYDSATSSPNVSLPSTAMSVTTPAAPDITPPSAPTNITAAAVSSSQINLSWTASTDSSGTVAGYKIYRSESGSSATLVASGVTQTSYGDTGLSASTTYSYYILAYDQSGNNSGDSNTVSATTKSNINPNVVYVYGTVTNANTKQPIAGVKVSTGNHGTASGAATATTNALGQYTLSNILPARRHIYHFNATGYNSLQVYKLYNAGTYELNKVLSPIN